MPEKVFIKPLTVGALRTNCYLVADTDTKQAVIVDPGDDAEYIINALRDLDCKPIQILATHGHFDHILAASELQLAFGIPFFMHAHDEFLVTRMQETARYFLKYNVVEEKPAISGFIRDKQKLSVGEVTLETIETPGHTPGSICFYIPKAGALLTGDTLFAEGGVGRTDFSYSSPNQLYRSIRKIFPYPEKTKLYPGHGTVSTIASESKIHRFTV